MVNLNVTVQNESGSGISGIPITCKVKNNTINPFAASNYYIHMPETHSNGVSSVENVQGYATFNCTANPNSVVANYTQASGSVSTTDLQDGNLTLVLKQIVSPIPTGASGQLSCPSGYTLSGNQCKQSVQTESVTASISAWISSHTIDFALLSVGLVAIAIIVFKFTSKSKSKSKVEVMELG